MSYIKIPIDNTPNSTQSFQVTLSSGDNVHILLKLRYHDLYDLWLADIGNADTNEVLISNMPVVLGENILGQFEYMGLGKAYIERREPSDLQHPNNKTLGTSFVLMWGD